MGTLCDITPCACERGKTIDFSSLQTRRAHWHSAPQRDNIQRRLFKPDNETGFGNSALVLIHLKVNYPADSRRAISPNQTRRR